MEVVLPGDTWVFGTILPMRVNWPTLRDFLAPVCPLGLPIDHLEMWLNGAHLNEQLVDCWNGFYARVVLTYHEVLPGFSQPYEHLWAPLPHLAQQFLPDDLSQHICLAMCYGQWALPLDGRSGYPKRCNNLPL